MNTLNTIIMSFSFLFSFLIIIISFFKRRRLFRFISTILLLIIVLAILYKEFDFPFAKNDLISKGKDDNEMLFYLILLFCVIIGMLSQYLYKYFSVPKESRPRFDIGAFIAPLFFSPIVVIPLSAAFLNAQVDLTYFNQQTFMIFIVAFENGFFWESVFNRQKQELLNKEKNIIS